MRERISQLAKGKIENQSMQIALSVSQIEETVTVDDKQRGDFYITSPSGKEMKGLVYSTNQKVNILTGHFLGKECRIYYEVDSFGVTEDLTGEIQLVTNGGEIRIPYTFHVKGESSDGRQISTLSEFAALAEESEEEAVKLFESYRFPRLPFMQDAFLNTVYDGLCNKGEQYNALEEFLIAAGARKPVHFSTREKKREYPVLTEAVCDDLIIKRNTKGYLHLDVSTDASFIRLDRTDISDLDFDGDRYALMYTILPAKLHPGVNFATITIKGLYETETLSIKVMAKANRSYAGGLTYKKDIAAFTSLYLELEAGGQEEKVILNKMQNVLNHAREYAPNTYSVPLYQTDISLRQGKTEQAETLFEQAKAEVQEKRDQDVAAYCYYLWLKARLSQDPAEKQNMIKLIRKYNDEGVAEEMTFFIMMNDDPDLKENASLTLSRLKEQYRKGSNSPYLYLAGCKILKKQPDLLRVMDKFEVKCLNYGSKNGLLSEEIAKTAAVLATQMKSNKKLCLNVLERLYKTYKCKEILTGICALRIRLEDKSKEAFTWYALGVKNDIHLTKLYEYYLYALPHDFEGPLPRMILLYFAMNNTLDSRAQAALYLNVLKYKKDDEEVYRAYNGQIESFAVDQLLQSHMNETLAEIYSRTIYPGMVDAKIAAILPKILYAKKIICSVPDMRQAILSYEEVRGETVAEMKGNETYLPVYLDHAHIVFQDSYGNRYANIPYKMEDVMHAPELAACLENTENKHEMIHLRSITEILKKKDYSEEEISLLKELSEQEQIRSCFRKQLTSEIISYYYKEEELSACDGYLLTIDKKLLKPEDRLKVMETLIAKEFFEEAYKMAARYGYQMISVSSVMEMTSHMIERRLYEKEDLLLELAKYCFEKNRFNQVILEYLCQHFNGICSKMFDVFKEAEKKRVNLYDLPERLLAQMLFTGVYENADEVYLNYRRSKHIDNMLKQAYLVVKAKLYFEAEKKEKGEWFKDLEEWVLHENVNQLPIICMLAVSRVYVDYKGLSDAQAELCQKMVDRLMRLGIFFRYYKNLVKFISLPRDFLEDTIIEYHGKPGQKLWIHQVLLPSEEELVPERLPHMYDGFYGRRFSLLCGEKLRYVIYEDGNTRKPLAGGTMDKETSPYGAAAYGPGTRVDMLNDLLNTDAEKDFAAWKEKAAEYAVRDEMIRAFFTMI